MSPTNNVHILRELEELVMMIKTRKITTYIIKVEKAECAH